MARKDKSAKIDADLCDGLDEFREARLECDSRSVQFS